VLKRTIVKGFCGIFLNPGTVLAAILLTAIICVLISIAGTGQARANGRIPLLSSTVTGVGTVSQPSLNESEMKVLPEQPGPNSTASDPVDNSGQSGEWQTVQMRVTAYCPCKKCCGEYSDGVTANGHKIRPGDAFVAADKEYPFGTEIIIAGYKNGQPVKVLDRGGVIVGNRLDVFFHSHEEALKWGVRHLSVKVRRE
jgi:3D (Asp-Asp-Asp) domain-containing protein